MLFTEEQAMEKKETGVQDQEQSPAA